jgi:rubrerythrin
MDLKGSRTEKNLLTAFAGESQARNRYTYFASAAKKEGYEKIAAAFLDSAENEKEHAKLQFKFLEGRPVEITATYPAGKIGWTVENLRAAAAGELYEWSEMYPNFCEIARKEGFKEIADVFDRLVRAEKGHEARYKQLLAELEAGNAFKSDQPTKWRCRNCGYIHEGPEAPKVCPLCKHPQAYFEAIKENW